MKKLFVILVALLYLTACGSKGYSKLTDGDEAIITGPNGYTFTKQDLYETLKPVSDSSIETDIYKKISENLEIDFTEIEEDIATTIDLYVSYGYISEADVDYYKKLFLDDSIFNELKKYYVNLNYDIFVEEDSPVKMEYAYFDTEEAANNFVESVKGGTDFATAASENEAESSVAEAVYIDSDSLPINVKSYLNNTASTGLSTIIVSGDSSTDADGNVTTVNKYYVLNISSKNVEDFKDDYITKRTEATSDETVRDYLFDTHEIKFYDQDIYEIMKAKYEVLK